MEHTKKFVLMDPRFARPSMQDKTLSGLDSDISNILSSDASDEAKAKSYAATLQRFKNIYNPPETKLQSVNKQPRSSISTNLKYKKFVEFLKHKKRSEGARKRSKLINSEIASHANIVSDADSDKEADVDWKQLFESLRKTSTPHPQVPEDHPNILQQSVQRNRGDKGTHYWADLSESLEKAPRQRKSARQQVKRKLWVQY
jgi:hypothetical protein